MSTFRESHQEGDFLYQIGSVTTKNAWKKPNPDNIRGLLDEIATYNKYKCYLVGGVVNGKLGDTWDIDIVVIGDIDLQEFEAFLHKTYDLALNKHNLLVDIRWIDKPMGYITKLINEGRQEKVKLISFGHCYKKSNGKESIIDLFKTNKKLTNLLVEREVLYPTQKALTSPNYFVGI